MKRVSAVLITFNEEQKIEQALKSVQQIADEIVVVDSLSTDQTAEICRRYTDRVLQRPWQGYRDQKQFATEQARHDWVLSLDADEVISPELQDEIQGWKNQSENGVSGYYLPRKTFFMGRWIEHTTWYPDWQLRLFRKSRGSWKGGRLHESFHISGPTGKMRGHIHHHTYGSVSEYLEQLKTFSQLAASDYHDRGRRATLAHLLFYPPVVFLRNYMLHRGFLDGVPGLTVSTLAAVSTFFKYLRLWEMQSEEQKGETS